MKTIVAVIIAAIAIVLGGEAVNAQSADELARQVRAAEVGFARTMATRDRTAFATFVADDAIFFNARGALRGKAAVVEAWARFFEGAQAPFSWEPDTVEVLESGALALTSGPVRDTDGKQIGTFNSVWRRDRDGRWRVVFDKGCS
jgi:ketosteroid isomerase-like protein